MAGMALKRSGIFERAEKGFGGMLEERLRLMWCNIGINYDESIYRWLQQQGVAFYYVYGMLAHSLGLRMGFYGDPWNGRQLTPLEEEARYIFYNSWGGRGRLYRVAKETLRRAWRYSWIHRRQKKRDFRRLWITRLNAAVRMRGLNYSRFMQGLKRANVALNRKILADLAINDPEDFSHIVELAKSQI